MSFPAYQSNEVFNFNKYTEGACGAVRGMVFPIVCVGTGVSVRMTLGKELDPHLVEELSQVEVKYDFYSHIGYVDPPDFDMGDLLPSEPSRRGMDRIR